jgi:hypothetical protein
MSDARSNGTSGDERIQAAWSQIASCLGDRKQQLYETIRNYPTPITACDQQFNYLLEQQVEISGELRRMHEIKAAATTGDAIDMLEYFVRSSSCLNDEAKQAIRSSLRP